MNARFLYFSERTFWFLQVFCFLVVGCYLPNAAVGQNAGALPHFSKQDSAQRVQLADQTAASVRKKFQPASRFDKATKADYLKKRDEIANNLSAEIAHFAITDSVLWPYIQKVHANIVTANPLMENTRVLLVADPIPNAYSIGDGTFVVHVGLLAGLESEDQLAFVICHEMAHYAFEHATKGLEAHVEEINSKEFKEKVKKLDAIEYNRSEQIEAVLKNMLFNNRYHSRNLERQSDSLAYQFLIRTNYNVQQAERLMEVFGSIDEPFRDSLLHFSSTFGCTQQPFQNSWLSTSGSSIWADARNAQAEANKAYRDSLSTHPDWKDRLFWLRELHLKTPPTLSESTPTSIDYTNIRYLAAIESVESWASVGRYDRALFLALHYQHIYPQCRYFREIEALALCQLYSHTQQHDLARVLAQSDDRYPENYNQYLNFLNNLRIKELLGLVECSLGRLPEEKSEYSLLAAYQLALAKNDKTTSGLLKKEYHTRFSEGRFNDYFKFHQ